MFDLSHLDNYLKRYELIKSAFIFPKEKSKSQTGRPCAGQAGQGPEAAGAQVGPGWRAGRGTGRRGRPRAGPNWAQAGHLPERSGLRTDGPGPGRMHSGVQAAVVVDGDLRRERDRGAGKIAEKERSSP